MGRAPCCEKVGLNRGRWTSEEDELLTKYIQANGEGSWRSLPKNAGLLRCGKSCRLRWINYLKDGLKRGNISAEEEDLIVKLHTSFGNRWSLIACHLPGRTDNEIKNYWNSHLSRKIYSFRRATAVDTTQPGFTDTPKVSITTPKPKPTRGGKTSRWAMKKNKINTQKGNQKEKLQNKEESASSLVPPPSTPSLESEVNLCSSTIEDLMVLDLDTSNHNNMVEREEVEKEKEEAISNNDNNEKEKKGLELEVQNCLIYEKENNNGMLLAPCDDLAEDIIKVDSGVLSFDDMMVDTLMLEASGVLTSSLENETNNNNNINENNNNNNNNNNNSNNNNMVMMSSEEGESNSVKNNVRSNNGEIIGGEEYLGNLDEDCWDWESVMELNNNNGSIIDESENCNWEEQRENLLAWLWEDDDLESESMKLGEKQNDMFAWILSE